MLKSENVNLYTNKYKFSIYYKKIRLLLKFKTVNINFY